jgi:predicted flap endonuclease-1-like 5' DNA nuclease
MTMFLIQSAILLAIAFAIGCIIGCLLRRMFASDDVTVPVTAAVVTAATVAAVAPRPEPAAAPVPPAPKPVPAPPAPVVKPVVAKPQPVAAPVMAKPAKPDDLKLLVGIGPVNERKLHALGITRFAQIAAWSPKDEASFGEKLEFPGRIEREEWVRQAKHLAAGGQSEDSAELARRKGSDQGQAKSAIKSAVKSVAKPVNSVGSTAKSSTAKPAATKPVAAKAKPVAPAKKPMPVKLDKAIGGKPDNLTLIDGIGNVIEKKLNEMGVFHFEQMSNWTMVQAEAFSKAVGFPGRALREGWVKEAAIFAKGGTTDHAKKVESGKITTSRISTAAEKGNKKS